MHRNFCGLSLVAVAFDLNTLAFQQIPMHNTHTHSSKHGEWKDTLTLISLTHKHTHTLRCAKNQLFRFFVVVFLGQQLDSRVLKRRRSSRRSRFFFLISTQHTGSSNNNNNNKPQLNS